MTWQYEITLNDGTMHTSPKWEYVELKDGCAIMCSVREESFGKKTVRVQSTTLALFAAGTWVKVEFKKHEEVEDA